MAAVVGVVSRLVTLDHGLQPFAVVGVAGRDADERGAVMRTARRQYPAHDPTVLPGLHSSLVNEMAAQQPLQATHHTCRSG